MTATTFSEPARQVMEAWVQSLGSFCWAQEQSDALLGNLIERGQVAREEGLQLSGKMAEQAKANQAELQKFIHHSVALSLEGLQKAHQAQIAAMQQRLEEMAAVISSLEKKVD